MGRVGSCRVLANFFDRVLLKSLERTGVFEWFQLSASDQR